MNGPTRVGQIAIGVRDLPNSVSFYRDVVGLHFLFEIPGAAFFSIGETRLMLSLPESEEFAGRASILYFDVADLQASYLGMSGRGAKFEGEPHLIAKMPDHDLWMAFFRDPEGNMMALMSEVRDANPR